MAAVCTVAAAQAALESAAFELLALQERLGAIHRSCRPLPTLTPCSKTPSAPTWLSR